MRVKNNMTGRSHQLTNKRIRSFRAPENGTVVQKCCYRNKKCVSNVKSFGNEFHDYPILTSQKRPAQLNKKQGRMCNTCNEKSKLKSNKEKRLKEKRHKCPKNDGKTKELPKCPKSKRPPAKAKKCLSELEKIMLRIQPPIADREKYLHPEHVNCFLEESERVYVQKLKCAPYPSKRPKICAEDKKKKKKKKHNGNSDGSDKDNDEKTENEKEKEDSEESGATTQEGEESIKVEGDKEKLEQSKVKSRPKKNKRRNHKAKRKHKEDIGEGSDSEMSIFSNDSEVCLVGLGLTKEDKKKIEVNRRKVHPPPDNEENSAESGKDIQGESKQEGRDEQ